MLSATEYQYIQGLTQNYYNNDYQQYLCITYTPDNYSNNNIYDVICYYSKDNLSISNNILSVPTDSIKCEFDSNNYSDKNTIDKLSCNSYSGNYTLNQKEFIYSNLNGYSDIIPERNYINNFNLIFISILSIIIIFFLYKFVSKIFRG